jgi:hypothetical protein
MKKTLSAAVTAAAMALLLSACGGGGSASGPSPSKPTTPTTPTTPAVTLAAATGVEARLLPGVVLHGGSAVTVKVTATVSFDDDAKAKPAVKLQQVGGDDECTLAEGADGAWSCEFQFVPAAQRQYKVVSGDKESAVLVLSVLRLLEAPPASTPAELSATVAGVDKDDDGVRDDVQAHVVQAATQLTAAQPGAAAAVQAALQQAAVVYQEALSAATAATPVTEAEQAEIAARQLRAVDCLYAVLGEDAAGAANAALVKAVLDTADRQDASGWFDQFFGGLVLRQTPEAERGKQCDFDPDGIGG